MEKFVSWRSFAIAALSFSVLTLASPGPVPAQETVASRGPALLRATPGISYGWALDGDVHGFGSDMSIAIGGFATPTFAVHLTALGSVLFNPGKSSYQINQDVYFYGVGVGVTHYALGDYWSLSVLVGQMRLSRADSGFTGPALEYLAGKDWPVGEHVRLGVAFGLVGYVAMEKLSDNKAGISPSVRFTVASP